MKRFPLYSVSFWTECIRMADSFPHCFTVKFAWELSTANRERSQFYRLSTLLQAFSFKAYDVHSSCDHFNFKRHVISEEEWSARVSQFCFWRCSVCSLANSFFLSNFFLYSSFLSFSLSFYSLFFLSFPLVLVCKSLFLVSIQTRRTKAQMTHIQVQNWGGGGVLIMSSSHQSHKAYCAWSF